MPRPAHRRARRRAREGRRRRSGCASCATPTATSPSGRRRARRGRRRPTTDGEPDRRGPTRRRPSWPAILSELRLVKDDYEIGRCARPSPRRRSGFDDVIADLPRSTSRRGRGERWVEGVFDRRARADGNDRRLRHDRRRAATARLHPALDPQRRRRRAGRPDPDRRRRRARLALHRRHHPHAARRRPLHRGAAPGLRGGARGAGRRRSRSCGPGIRFRDIHAAAMAGHRREARRVGAAAGERWRRRCRPTASSTAARWCTAPATTSASTCTTARRPARELYLDGVLEPGMVFTVEPGPVLPARRPDACPRSSAASACGSRTTSLVTEDGAENLSRRHPAHGRRRRGLDGRPARLARVGGHPAGHRRQQLAGRSRRACARPAPRSGSRRPG